MRLRKPDEVKTLTLSDGTIASVRRARGGDLIRAQDVAGDKNPFKFICAMLAQITQIDGEPCVLEDIAELWASDINLLATEAGADNFLSSTGPSSLSSSSGGFGSTNSMN